MEGLGVIGVGAPGMPPAAAREPTAVALQRKTSGLRTGAAAAAAAAAGSHDSSSAVMSEASSLNYAAGLPHYDTPVRRRPRAGDAAAAAAVRESSDLALSHFSIESGDNSLGDAYDAGSVFSPGAGPQAFQLKWPLQPQPVNSAHSHLSNAAAKISAAVDRYSSAVGTSKLPNAHCRQAQQPGWDWQSSKWAIPRFWWDPNRGQALLTQQAVKPELSTQLNSQL